MIIDVNELFDELGHLPQVEAIALGGSRVQSEILRRSKR